jgi:hypothetical protein
VIFVNYEDIKTSILNSFPLVRGKDGATKLSSSSLEYKSAKVVFEEQKEIWFYSSDYSDILAMNNLTNFVEEFVPFFEKLHSTPLLTLTQFSPKPHPILSYLER